MSEVYKIISAIQDELSKTGIAKEGKNEAQKYKFRGIDAVYQHLAPLLAKHKLCILPRVLSREVVEGTTKSGGALFRVWVDVEFDLVCVKDGSTHTIRTIGEAMDSSDKATNKAMSAAYKYACFMTFCIPTEGDNDADNSTPEPAPKKPTPKHLSFKELSDKVGEAKAIPHLQNVWTKYAKDIAALPEEQRELLTKAKDIQKGLLTKEGE